MNEIVEASKLLQAFKGDSFTKRVSKLENDFNDVNRVEAAERIEQQQIGQELFTAAMLIKHNSSQINEVIHALGILISLQYHPIGARQAS